VYQEATLDPGNESDEAATKTFSRLILYSAKWLKIVKFDAAPSVSSTHSSKILLSLTVPIIVDQELSQLQQQRQVQLQQQRQYQLQLQRLKQQKQQRLQKQPQHQQEQNSEVLIFIKKQ
jgi:hypothetical protein